MQVRRLAHANGSGLRIFWARRTGVLSWAPQPARLPAQAAAVVCAAGAVISDLPADLDVGVWLCATKLAWARCVFCLLTSRDMAYSPYWLALRLDGR